MFLDEYENEIKRICDDNNIYSLSNFDKVKFDDKNSRHFLSLISRTRDALNNEGKFDMLFTDLVESISPAIKFSIANTFLYLEYANNYVNETRVINRREVTTYFKTLGDVRFFYYLNASFEKLYNYWDRVGDILEYCFDLKMNPTNIYFASVIENLFDKKIKSTHLAWLMTFKRTYYSDYLNRIRKLIVHYRQKETYFFDEWLGSISDDNHREKMKELQIEKESYPKNLNEQLKIANEGFEHMVRLIAEHGVYEKREDLTNNN